MPGNESKIINNEPNMNKILLLIEIFLEIIDKIACRPIEASIAIAGQAGIRYLSPFVGNDERKIMKEESHNSKRSKTDW